MTSRAESWLYLLNPFYYDAALASSHKLLSFDIGASWHRFSTGIG